METASVRVEAPSFPKMEATWNFTVCSEIDKRPAISLLPSPAEIIWSTSRSRGVSASGSSRVGDDNAAGAGRTALTSEG